MQYIEDVRLNKARKISRMLMSFVTIEVFQKLMETSVELLQELWK